MIKYSCTSKYSNDLTWEDFFSAEDAFPNVSVYDVYQEKDDDGKDVEIKVEKPEFFKADDGWYDAYVPEFNEENIKNVIALINGTSPENIIIQWLGIAQAS